MLSEEKIRNKWKEVNEEIKNKYGLEYPKKEDNHGWILIGRLEGLSWVLHRLNENGIEKI